MTPDELDAAGYRLYGRHWQTPLARALGINGRSLRRWLSGQNAIPASVAADVAALLAIAARHGVTPRGVARSE